MTRRLWLRLGIVVVAVLASVFYLYPPKKTVNLGLDLQGGIHLVLGVDLDKALQAQVERTGDGLRIDLEKKGIGVRIERRGNTELALQLASPAQWNDAQPVIRDYSVFESREADAAAGRVVLALTAREATSLRELAVRQGLETIRNRVDQFGVAEPSIQQQGDNRILIQLPGVQDPERAKALIGKTALLEFKLVDERTDPEAALRGGAVPEGSEVLYQRRVDKQTKQETRIPYLVQKKAVVTGRDLSTARVSIDQTTSDPYVSAEFNAAGAKAFGDVTEANVNKRLAIVLDGNVHSAPVIRERIPGGRAQITGGFTMEEASDLAIVLRAGALPAPVQVLEERTVGPSLGADSIRQGIVAILASTALVVLFMLFYYRLSGVIADVALGLNLLVLLAVMAGFHATLTLPGIAGIALTIGMAVDTNILIFERIREELRAGKTVRAAIQMGFSRAFTTVIDTHVTVLVSAIILYNFGTGPVRGFALSLGIGILASLFTAVFFTRLLFDLVYVRGRRASLSI